MAPWKGYLTRLFSDLPYYDGTTGEIFAMYRVVSPNYGRWQSPDPVGGDPSNPQSWNGYAYVMNNPASLTDPLGLDPNCGPGQNTGPCSPQARWQSNLCDSGMSIFCGTGVTTPSLLGIYEFSNWDVTESGYQNGDFYINSGWLTTYMFLGTGFPTGPGGGENNEPCSDVPNGPLGANVDFNVSLVNTALQTDLNWSSPTTKMAFFYDMVNTGNPWDYKQQDTQYVDFGNFNYGATCEAMRYSLYFCQSAAGFAHDRRLHKQGLPLGKGIPFLKPPYGDQTADQAQIAKGYRYAKCKSGH